MPLEMLTYNVYVDQLGTAKFLGEVVATSQDEAMIVAQHIFDATALRVYLAYKCQEIEFCPFIKQPNGEFKYLPKSRVRRSDVFKAAQKVADESGLTVNEVHWTLDELPEYRYNSYLYDD